MAIFKYYRACSSSQHFQISVIWSMTSSLVLAFARFHVTCASDGQVATHTHTHKVGLNTYTAHLLSALMLVAR